MRVRIVTLLVLLVLFAMPVFVTQMKTEVAKASNLPPVAVFTYTPQIPTPGQSIVFNASTSYDPDGTIVQYAWDFGDGNATTIAAPIITHSYPVDGNYTVQLTVTDNNGLSNSTVQVVSVNCVEFFRVVYQGTLIPVSNIQVTMYYYNGSAWTAAPASNHGAEIKYDLVTQPNLAQTSAQKYRNPGYTASILLANASNIGWDIHHGNWLVYFKFTISSTVSVTWPNATATVYCYKKGVVQSYNYLPGHQAYWDPSAGTYVIRAHDIAGNGVAPTQSHPIIVGVAIPPPQKKYYLTVQTNPSGITSIPGTGSYASNTNVTLTAPAYVNVSSSMRYRFSYWDTDGVSRGNNINPITVQMTANHTATAHYVTQYSTLFTQTGISSDATGTIVTANGNSIAFSNLPYTLWADSGSSVTYSYNSPVSTSISGKRYRLNTVTGPTSPITVTSSTTVTGNFVTQYSVTFAQSGMDSSASGTVLTANGSLETFSSLPYTLWVDSGTSVKYSYNTPVSSSISGKQFQLTSVTGPTSPIIVTSANTVTGNYVIQYLVTFTQTGLDSTASGTIVTVNGNSETFGVLPYSLWVNSGSSVTYTYNNPVSSTSSSKRFRLNSISGASSPFTVTGPATITGNYVTQFLVTFAQSMLDSTATGTIVTVNSSPQALSGLPFNQWVDSGSSITYSYSSIVSSSATGKQFRLNSVTGPTSPITVTASATVTGNYMTQYLLTFTNSGLDSSATGTVVTVNGNAKAFTSLPYTLWADSGSSVTYSYSQPVSSSITGKQFRLASVTGQSSPIAVAATATITGSFVTQYTVTFGQSGLDTTASGTVVTINGAGEPYTSLPYALWVDSGASVTYSYNSVVLSSVQLKRFSIVTVSGSSSPITVTTTVSVSGSYKIQYQVTFDQSGIGSDFTGTIVTIDSVNYNGAGLPIMFWWDQGSNHNFSYMSPLTVNATKQYVWNSASGLSNLQSGTLNGISNSGSVTGSYVVANCVTFSQTGTTSSFTGTIVVVDGVSYGYGSLPVSFMWTLGSSHNFAFQSPLVVTVNGTRYIWNSTSGLSLQQSGSITITSYGNIVGNYKKQYYINLLSNPVEKASPSGTGWYYVGSYASISTSQYVYGGSRYMFISWTTQNMSEIANPSSPSTIVLIDGPKTITANYIHQYLVTFLQTGLTTDASGTIVTVNGTLNTYSNMPYSIWVNTGGTISYSYQANVASTISSKQFRLTGTVGPSSPITVANDLNITGNYVSQYYLTVTSPYGTPGSQGWYDNGTTAYASLSTGLIDHGNNTRHAFTGWSGDSSGSNYAQSNPVTMNGAKTAIANWKTQYQVSFQQTGLDSSASSTVVTVNSSPQILSNLPYSIWTDSGSTVSYSYSNVSSSTSGKRFTLTSVSGSPSPVTITNPVTIIGNYKTQYQITFSQSGINSDFTGSIATIDGKGYNLSALPASFWWDSSSAHSFIFYSPLVVSLVKQYTWSSTSGLTSLQNGTLIVTNSGSVAGSYVSQTKYQITFMQSGAGSDFNGTVVTIDGSNYKVTNLPCTFYWNSGSVHSFAFQSPLTVGVNFEQYVWISTTGLSNSISGSMTVTTSGNVTGYYKTQYYLSVATSPNGVTSTSGAGWYDANTATTISTPGFVTISQNARYRFNGWTTANMSEIANYMATPTTVTVDKAKTVTALYVIQYRIIFSANVGSDFNGTIVTVDNYDNYSYVNLSAKMWYDNGSLHSFAFQSPLTVAANVKRYIWTSTSGLTTNQTGIITIITFGNVSATYKVQYYVTISSSYGSPSPGSEWFNSGASFTESITSPIAGPTGTQYVCIGYTGVGGAPSGNTTSVTFTVTQQSSVIWNWKTQYYLSVATIPTGIVSIPGQGWYDASAQPSLTAPTVLGYKFQNWDIDNVVQGTAVTATILMSGPHTAVANYITLAAFNVTISPMSATIVLGQNVQFTSLVNGGASPYAYQWYLNFNLVSGATASIWTFAPTASGTYFVKLIANDSNGQAAPSAVATITVNPKPVGGYSISLSKPIPSTNIEAYVTLIICFGAVLSLIKRKRK